MATFLDHFRAAAKASAANEPIAEHLEKLNAAIKDGDLYNALMASLRHCPGISAHIAASETPISTALDVNRMSEELRRELCFQVDLGL